MSDSVLSVAEYLNTLVDNCEQLLYAYALDIGVVEKLGLREHLDEVETTAYSSIQQGDGAVGGIHGSDDINVVGNAERLLGICQPYLYFFGHTEAL